MLQLKSKNACIKLVTTRVCMYSTYIRCVHRAPHTRRPRVYRKGQRTPVAPQSNVDHLTMCELPPHLLPARGRGWQPFRCLFPPPATQCVQCRPTTEASHPHPPLVRAPSRQHQTGGLVTLPPSSSLHTLLAPRSGAHPNHHSTYLPSPPHASSPPSLPLLTDSSPFRSLLPPSWAAAAAGVR